MSKPNDGGAARLSDELLSYISCENARLRLALQWYAQQSHYLIPENSDTSAVMNDRGKVARNALLAARDGEQS